MAYNSLGDLFTAIADAIRAKKGTSSTISAQNFPSQIASIETTSSATASAKPTSAYVLSFSVNGQPKVFTALATATIYNSSSTYRICLAISRSASGSVRCIGFAHNSSSRAGGYYSTTVASVAYSSGMFTITLSSSYSWQFDTDTSYTLIYTY